MAAVFCTVADVESVLSRLGVELRSQDESSVPVLDTAHVNDAIEEASEDAALFLLERYESAALATSAWLKRKVAFLAACSLMIRRGEGMPQSWIDKRDEIFGFFKQIMRHILDIPGLAVAGETMPTVSNYRVALRFPNMPVRVNTSASTGRQPKTYPRFVLPSGSYGDLEWI